MLGRFGLRRFGLRIFGLKQTRVKVRLYKLDSESYVVTEVSLLQTKHSIIMVCNTQTV